MNYDFNDGIPPYDIPFNGDNDEELNKETSSAEQGPQEGAEVVEDYPHEKKAQDENNSAIDNDTDETSEPNDNENEDTEGIDNISSKNSTKVIIPIIIMVSILFLGAALYLIYEENMTKEEAKKVINIAEVEEIDIVESVPIERNTISDKLKVDKKLFSEKDVDKILNENSEIINVESLRQRRAQLINQEKINKSLKESLAQERDTIKQIPNESELDKVEIKVNEYRENIGRLDPFNPVGDINQLYDVLIPPSNPIADEDTVGLATMRVSGIMYTPDSPSALININSEDFLVRRGDKFNGYSVEKITQENVTVRFGANVFTASVGESIAPETVGVNAIPNLNNKFAGPYSKGGGKIIEINTLN